MAISLQVAIAPRYQSQGNLIHASYVLLTGDYAYKLKKAIAKPLSVPEQSHVFVLDTTQDRTAS